MADKELKTGKSWCLANPTLGINQGYAKFFRKPPVLPFSLCKNGGKQQEQQSKYFTKALLQFQEKELLKKDSIPGDNYSQMEELPNTTEQLYSEGSHLNFPFFEPARKAFEQP